MHVCVCACVRVCARVCIVCMCMCALCTYMCRYARNIYMCMCVWVGGCAPMYMCIYERALYLHVCSYCYSIYDNHQYSKILLKQLYICTLQHVQYTNFKLFKRKTPRNHITKQICKFCLLKFNFNWCKYLHVKTTVQLA